jgi:hypothetical protein
MCTGKMLPCERRAAIDRSHGAVKHRPQRQLRARSALYTAGKFKLLDEWHYTITEVLSRKAMSRCGPVSLTRPQMRNSQNSTGDFFVTILKMRQRLAEGIGNFLI